MRFICLHVPELLYALLEDTLRVGRRFSRRMAQMGNPLILIAQTLLVGIDAVLLAGALTLSFALRFEWRISNEILARPLRNALCSGPAVCGLMMVLLVARSIRLGSLLCAQASS